VKNLWFDKRRFVRSRDSEQQPGVHAQMKAADDLDHRAKLLCRMGKLFRRVRLNI
jgi:hypothetical protein